MVCKVCGAHTSSQLHTWHIDDTEICFPLINLFFRFGGSSNHRHAQDMRPGGGATGETVITCSELLETFLRLHTDTLTFDISTLSITLLKPLFLFI